ncbi:hypothetical protein HKD37_15G043138 [Glycine soja]|uniref:DUF4283 domain-containing protein n=2 Tax=Glycine soja TaxID=3848 RepID=A0A445GVH5_GLYSO|nr:hypothetical protein D0Y65_041376 [Glycine soja]
MPICIESLNFKWLRRKGLRSVWDLLMVKGSNNETLDGGGGNKVSFRDKGMQGKILYGSRPMVDLFKQNLAKIEYKDGNPHTPKVHIHDSVFEGLHAPWQDALVIKLLGKSIAYPILRDKLDRTRKLKVGFDMFDIHNGYFMLNFDHEEDRKKVIDEGLWNERII